jgi:hypothetical protein
VDLPVEGGGALGGGSWRLRRGGGFKSEESGGAVEEILCRVCFLSGGSGPALKMTP